MNKKLCRVFAIQGMLILLGAHTALAEEWVLTKDDNGRTITVLLKQAITINLPSNPSTGFAWQILPSTDTSVISSGPATYIQSPGTGTGGGGISSFPFKAVEAGKTTLDLVYVQPWHPQDISSAFTVTFNVIGPVVIPQLSIAREGSQIRISWPVDGGTGFFLEGCADLNSPQWAALNAMPLSDGQNYSVRLSPGGDSLFFRLRKS